MQWLNLQYASKIKFFQKAKMGERIKLRKLDVKYRCINHVTSCVMWIVFISGAVSNPCKGHCIYGTMELGESRLTVVLGESRLTVVSHEAKKKQHACPL